MFAVLVTKHISDLVWDFLALWGCFGSVLFFCLFGGVFCFVVFKEGNKKNVEN